MGEWVKSNASHRNGDDYLCAYKLAADETEYTVGQGYWSDTVWMIASSKIAPPAWHYCTHEEVEYVQPFPQPPESGQ